MLDKELGIESMAVVGDANFAIELSFLDAIHKKINKRKKNSQEEKKHNIRERRGR
jgi:hypothetical protein